MSYSTTNHRLFNNSLRPSDTMQRDSSESTMAQVMACCLTAPSHYLNQCWLLISDFLWQVHPRVIFGRVPKLLFCKMSLKTILLRLLSCLPGAKELNDYLATQGRGHLQTQWWPIRWWHVGMVSACDRCRLINQILALSWVCEFAKSTSVYVTHVLSGIASSTSVTWNTRRYYWP